MVNTFISSKRLTTKLSQGLNNKLQKYIYIREFNIPKAESLSKNVSLLLLTVTETVSVAILKVTSALYGSSLLQSSASSEVAVIFRKLLTL